MADNPFQLQFDQAVRQFYCLDCMVEWIVRVKPIKSPEDPLPEAPTMSWCPNCGGGDIRDSI